MAPTATRGSGADGRTRQFGRLSFWIGSHPSTPVVRDDGITAATPNIIQAASQPGTSTIAMGHSKAEKEESHARIVRTAAARFREVGLEGMSVADLMKEAGLTHGGFYRHFDTREDLVAEAVEQALAEGSKGAFDAHASGRLAPEALLHALIDWYLGTAHRDQLATSCAVTSLAADVSRSNPRARSAYTRQVEAYLELFTVLIGGPDPAAARAHAISAWAALVGAVSMARAVNDDALSRDILETAATRLKADLA